MKMSTKGRYGLRVMIELACRYGQGPVLVDAIERNCGISGKYIHQIMLSLKYAGMVRTVRGPHGGYELVKKPSEVTALDVITILEGSVDPVECVSCPSVCGRASDCVTRDLWEEVGSAIRSVLSSVTLEALCARQALPPDQGFSFCI